MGALLPADLRLEEVRRLLAGAGWEEVPVPGLRPPLVAGEPELARFERDGEVLHYTCNPAVWLRLLEGGPVPATVPTLGQANVAAMLVARDPEVVLRGVLGAAALGWKSLAGPVREAVERLPPDVAPWGRSAAATLEDPDAD